MYSIQHVNLNDVNYALFCDKKKQNKTTKGRNKDELAVQNNEGRLVVQ